MSKFNVIFYYLVIFKIKSLIQIKLHAYFLNLSNQLKIKSKNGLNNNINIDWVKITL
jgi:hypothetical protein